MGRFLGEESLKEQRLLSVGHFGLVENKHEKKPRLDQWKFSKLQIYVYKTTHNNKYMLF